MRKRIVLGLVAAAANVAVADDDAADDTPVPQAVTGRLDGRTAVLSARYLMRFEGAAESVIAALELPPDAVATAATVRAGGVTRRLALTAAERARAQFDGVIERPAGPARRWAMLIEDGHGTLDISLIAPRAGAVTLEVELAVPTCFHDDVRYVEIPDTWKAAFAPSLRLRAARAREVTQACHEFVGDEPAAWIGFPDPALARRSPGPDRVGATAGRLVLDTKHIARVDVEIARMLGELPRDLATALVVDASHSLTPEQRASQRELVGAYLAAARGSQAQVIAYARTAHALLPAWTAAVAAAPRVDAALAALAPRNGSNVDVGLAEAATWLGRIPGTRRIVLVTDERLAARLQRDPAALARRLPPDTLVHVVAIDDDGELQRDDDAVLAPLAAATGGIAVRGGTGGDVPLDATQLVRPISLDRVRVEAPGWTQLSRHAADVCQDRLLEGGACTWWGEGDALAGPLTVEGFVWGRKVARVLAPDAGRAHELARTFPDANVLDDETQRAELFRTARAINADWSLYAEWGGADGYDDGFGFLRGGICCGSSHSSASHTIGMTSGRRAAPLPPLDLAPQLASVPRTCDLRGARVEAEIETTRSEIVDVRVTAPPAVRACVEEAIWATALVIPAAYPRATTRVAW